MSIGSRIKERRISLSMTQEELAKKIGVTKGAIANYENEVSSPKIDLMYKLFEALDCDANYLHQDDMKIPNRDIIKEALLFYYSQLNEEGREKVTEYARDLVDSGRYIKNNQLDMVETEIS